jgi:hypothetical protein
MYWANRITLIVFTVLLALFWLSPKIHNSTVLTWAGILLVTGCALYLSFAYCRFLSMWRGLGAPAALLLLTLTWLHWQWPLWGSPIPLLQRVNIVVSLLAWALFIAVFISSTLLLIRKDASVIFMGLAWVLIPLVLLAVGMRYERFDQFTAASLGERIFWGPLLLWALGMLCLGPLAFAGHFLILLIKELSHD